MPTDDDNIGDFLSFLEEKKDLKSQMIIRYKDRYQWFLLPAILLLALEAGLSERRRIRRASPVEKAE